MPHAPAQHRAITKAAKSHGHDDRRGSAASRGYDSRWRKARRLFLQQHPLCVHCEAEGIIKPATVVDHIVPHRGDKALFWAVDNWQALCERHHNIKTAKGQ